MKLAGFAKGVINGTSEENNQRVKGTDTFRVIKL